MAKKINMLRIKYKPEAGCDDCGWPYSDPIINLNARKNAQAHAKATGHTSFVEISDITTYTLDTND